MGHALAGGFDNRTTWLPALSSTGDDSRPPSCFFTPQNRGAVIQALPAARLKRKQCQILTFPQSVLPSRRPHNQQLQTAIVTVAVT